MATSAKNSATVEEVKENLVSFSMNRDDLKFLLGRLPQDDGIDLVAVEYEIQLLKIITVGWSLSYFMTSNPKKQELTEAYWKTMHEMSQQISYLTSISTGKDIDYFSVLKERLDLYLQALNANPDASDPVYVIGPAFARVCKNESNPHIILAGSKAFSISLAGVKEYLDSIEIE